MRVSKGRGQKSYKGYIAVFICMATKAIHLEAVSDLSTDAFLAALRRFFGRGGKSSQLYSDNGTNFVGTAKKLDGEYEKAIRNLPSIAGTLAAEKITWHFIPPGGLHFGGIWEAAVKSMKHYLRCVIGEVKLTYEEMSTLLIQVEAVLNSRPLCEVRDDIENADVLTPGYFLF
ncbi:uncharacterized protein LOC119689587 [Teleopsis dalmanni]|uniref:uncharacterized protein LOC119689587 n=1 Tax=Teleopsis dalmanni TaxID=139649 RepID=UPI0018CE4DD2|nr:uncharacterized protein LOC119689587 [Teleopsis dalmanni]